MFHASPSGSLGTLFLLLLGPWWSLQGDPLGTWWRVVLLRGRFHGSDTDEKQRKQKKTHPVHPKENVVNGPGAPALSAKSDLTVFNIFLLVLRAVINATMYEPLGGHESSQCPQLVSRSVSLKDPKATSFTPTTSLWPLKVSALDFFFNIIWTNLVENERNIDLIMIPRRDLALICFDLWGLSRCHSKWDVQRWNGWGGTTWLSSLFFNCQFLWWDTDS